MGLKCKPGDLAIVVFAVNTPQILGHIVEVVGPWTGPIYDKGEFAWEVRYPDGQPILTANVSWLTGKILGHGLVESRPFADSGLMPIREVDGEDETLTWAGKPEGVTM